MRRTNHPEYIDFLSELRPQGYLFVQSGAREDPGKH